MRGVMSLLPTGLLARWFPQTADTRRLLQSVTGWRLATVTAVQPEPALQLGNLSAQCRHLGSMASFLRQQQRNDGVFRELVERGAIHRILRIGPPKSCQPKSGSRPASRHGIHPPAPAHHGRPAENLGSYLSLVTGAE